jgi:hypothetical protein
MMLIVSVLKRTGLMDTPQQYCHLPGQPDSIVIAHNELAIRHATGCKSPTRTHRADRSSRNLKLVHVLVATWRWHARFDLAGRSGR